ncbi:MAG: hypothetical protein ACT4PP_14520 [Sporichthyaceae bacterium]
MNTASRITTATAAALIAGLAFVPAAHGAAAGFVDVERDAASINERSATQSNTAFSTMRWRVGVGGDSGSTQGFLNGVLTYRGGTAGCAKLVVTWLDGSNRSIGSDVRRTCTTNSLPSEIRLRNVSHQQSGLNCASIKLYYSHAPNEDSFRFDGGRVVCVGS